MTVYKNVLGSQNGGDGDHRGKRCFWESFSLIVFMWPQHLGLKAFLLHPADRHTLTYAEWLYIRLNRKILQYRKTWTRVCKKPATTIRVMGKSIRNNTYNGSGPASVCHNCSDRSSDRWEVDWLGSEEIWHIKHWWYILTVLLLIKREKISLQFMKKDYTIITQSPRWIRNNGMMLINMKAIQILKSTFPRMWDIF